MAFESLSQKLNSVFRRLGSKGKLNESDINTAMREVKLALLEADVSYVVVKDFIASVSAKAKGAAVMESLTPVQMVIKIVRDELIALMGESEAKINFSNKPPTVVLLAGLQGSGKTTHCAKLALHFKKQGKRPLMVACDVYRPAAIDQLKVLGEKNGLPVYSEDGSKDPPRIAENAVKHAKQYGNDLVLIDTAGRLHIDEALMEELAEIKRRTQPHEILLVIDAMTGQDAVNVAKSFNEKLEIDGVILTKLDGDTRGGAALAVRHITGKPIKFTGVGEKIDELEPFYPDRAASRILGMGDMLSFIEKAEAEFDEKQGEELLAKLEKNKFDLNDMLMQFRQVKKMGSIKKLIGMLPGTQGIDENSIDEKAFPRMEAIILSMTPAERTNPSILNASRRKRIAEGSGTNVQQVNKLIKQYEQTKELMKKFTGKGKFGKFRKGGQIPPDWNL